MEHQKTSDNPRKMLLIKIPQTSGIRLSLMDKEEEALLQPTFPLAQERQAIKHYRLLTGKKNILPKILTVSKKEGDSK